MKSILALLMITGFMALAPDAARAAVNAQEPLDAGTAAMAIALPGLEALPLDNKVVIFNNVNPTFDETVPGRMVALTAQTPTAPGAAVNYYRSILMGDGWKPVGIASANEGIMMSKNGQMFQLHARYNTSHNKGGATILEFSITDLPPGQ